MRLNIRSLVGRKGASFQVQRTLPSDFVEDIPEVKEALGPVDVELRVTNTGEGYLVTGDVSLEVEFYCSRCLKPVASTITASFDEEFRSGKSEPAMAQEGEEDLWDEEALLDGDEIDATELIEESVLVSIPMKIVCSPDCPGLCPTCGADLAQGECDCLSPEIDIRLSPLSKLLTVSETTTPERRKDHGSSKKKTLQSED